MNKGASLEESGQPKLPIPQILIHAFENPEHKYPFGSGVSHARYGEGGNKLKKTLPKPIDTSCVLYLGKFPQNPTFFERCREIATGKKSRESIYSPAAIKSMLSYLARALPSSYPIKIHIGRSLSSLCNGESDLEGYATYEEQISMLTKWATELGISSERLQIQKMEAAPWHQSLFDRLKASQNEERELDVKNVFSEDELNLDNTETLFIANQLYLATQKSHEFNQAIKATIPAEHRTGTEEEIARRQCYGFIEIAMRTSDLLHGVIAHAGVDRQGVYDGIIIKLIKGKKGSFKQIPELHPVFELLQNKSFETVHFDPDNNGEQCKVRRNLARTRLAIMGVLAGIAIFCIKEGKEKYDNYLLEQKEKELVTALREELDGMRLYIHAAGLHKIEEKRYPKIFLGEVESLLKEMEQRYKISAKELKIPFMTFLIKHKREFSTAYNNYNYSGIQHLFLILLEAFIHENRLYFLHNKVSTDHPFPEISREKNNLRNLANSSGPDLVIEQKQIGVAHPQDPNYVSKKYKSPQLIGRFTSLNSHPYELYSIETHSGERFIVGKTVGEKYVEGMSGEVFFSEEAKKAGKEYFTILQNKECAKFFEWRELILRFGEDSRYVLYIPPIDQEFCNNENYVKKIGIYRDHVKNTAYEIGIYYHFDFKQKKTQQIIVARLAGSKEPFSLPLGRRFAREFKSYYHGF